MLLLSTTGGVLLALLVVIVMVLANPATPVATDDAAVAGPAPAAPLDSAPATRRLSSAEAEGVWRNVRPFVVEVIVKTPQGINSGTGFVVDKRGWIATSRRLVEGASRITIVPAPDSVGRVGATAEATAILVDNPEQDIAIVQAETLRIRSQPQLLQGDITADDHITCGAPVTARGAWTHVATPSTDKNMSLPGDVKFELMSAASTPGLSWISYPGELPVTSTGGPLVTRTGEVAGINLAASSALGQVYALHAKHIAASLAKADPAKPDRRLGPEKLASAGENFDGSSGIKNSLAATAGGTDDPANPFGASATIEEPDGTPTKPAAPPGATPGSSPEDPTVVRIKPPEVEVMKTTAENIRKNLDAAEAFDLEPQTKEQYLVLQQLARMMTEATKPGADANATSEANAALQVLATSEWPREAAITRTHELAQESFGRGEKGLYLYGKMQGIVTSEDGADMLYFRLPNTRDFVAIPAKDNLREVRPETEWLLIGTEITERAILVPMEVDGATRNVNPVLLDAVHIISKPTLPGRGP